MIVNGKFVKLFDAITVAVCTDVLLLFLFSLQEASEFEVVNVEGKTSDALTVRTRLWDTHSEAVNYHRSSKGRRFFFILSDQLFKMFRISQYSLPKKEKLFRNF